MSQATPVSSKRVTLNGNNHFLVDVYNIAQTNASTLATEDRMNRTSGTGRDRDYNVWEASRDVENPSQLPGEASVPPNKNDAYSTEKRS
ncbi:hypothetical protein DPMN_068462 [Dreissena polymorpha]|uniref:Uncharacterized protein n=1 Tax=Dreissena polymorpha TaxID=45954 RepID=A0A9D3Z2A7_DREPO|nr:hypothetical protein DPMN_068462 [Dreissena polymorpha]